MVSVAALGGDPAQHDYSCSAMSLHLICQKLLPKQALTRLAGAGAHREGGALTQWAIRRFIDHYGVAMQEAANPDPAAYRTFNDFFTRALRDGARPLADAPLIDRLVLIHHDRLEVGALLCELLHHLATAVVLLD